MGTALAGIVTGEYRIARVEERIFLVRGMRVMLDSDLARLYGVPTKALNQAVKRNQERFPEIFMFRLTARECANLRSQVVISRLPTMRSQIVTASRRNLRFQPFAFTEHGALMTANVLNSPRAIRMSVQIIAAFVRLRRMALSVEALARKVGQLESRYDAKFKGVFEAIRQLMAPPDPPRRQIGFHVCESRARYRVR